MKSLILKAGLAGTFLAAAPVLAFAADPVAPVQERYGSISGNVAIWGQYVKPDDYGERYEADEGSYDYYLCDDSANFCDDSGGIGGDARIHFALGNGQAIQLEALGDWHRVFDRDDSGEDATLATAGGHWIYRTGAMAFGAFGGLTYADHISESANSYSAQAFGGVEAAAFLGNATLFGQLGYGSGFEGQDYVEDITFGRLGARYFVTENDRLEGWVGYGYSDKAEEGDDAELEWFQLAANYERQISTTPLSAFVGYQGDYVKRQETGGWDDSERTWAHTFKVGARWSFGGSLQHEDREGARTFDFMNLRAPLAYADDLD